MKLVKLNSDNYTDQLMTAEAYKAATLQMSTGDFATHKHTYMDIKSPDMENVLTLEDIDPTAATESYLNQYSKADQTLIKELLYKRPDSYMGEDFYNTISVVGRHRDSNIIENSNFECALETLGGESDVVISAGASHWAVGWVESLRVHIKDKTATLEALKIIRALADYPVLDDSDLSERELESQAEDLNQYMGDFCENVLEFCGIESDNDDFDSLKTDPDTEAVASALYSDACGYFGTEEGFVYAEKIPNFACKYNLQSLADDGNECAALVLACMGGSND